MEKLNYEIREEYGHELEEIGNILRQLKEGRVYEKSNAKMDGYLATNAEKLEIKIKELLSKIQNGDDGFNTAVAKFF